MEKIYDRKGKDVMGEFRFAIMGAGHIANKFCDAVSRLPDVAVTAVASKSVERAQEFAARNGIGHAYGDYEEMLEQEKPDGVYIAVLPSDHFRLSMLCMEHNTPVLCEKAMFTGSREAEKVFAEAGKRKVFVMEAMWSRFLPTVQKAKQWIAEGRIGEITYTDFEIGFLAEKNPENRFFNKKVAGGAAYDVTVYAYEIVSFLMGQDPADIQVAVMRGETGVDVTDHVVLQYPDCMASLTASIVAPMDDRLAVYGSGGRIVLPLPHHGSEALLYDKEGMLAEHFLDRVTENGFTYEIREAVDCIRAGKVQSDTAPWKMTADCAALFDRIEEELGKKA